MRRNELKAKKIAKSGPSCKSDLLRNYREAISLSQELQSPMSSTVNDLISVTSF